MKHSSMMMSIRSMKIEYSNETKTMNAVFSVRSRFCVSSFEPFSWHSIIAHDLLDHTRLTVVNKLQATQEREKRMAHLTIQLM